MLQKRTSTWGRKAVATAIVFILLLAGANLAGEKNADMKRVAEDNTDFAFDMYGKLKSGKGNVFFSPFSISTALAMTYGGARGNTETEMGKVMRYTLDQEKLHAAMGALIDDLNGRTVKEGWGENRKDVRPFELVVANALWGQWDYKFKKEFIELNNKHYEAGLTNVDFKTDPEKARVTINKWVEEQTNDKIKDLIQKGQIKPAIRLVLTNAIYFKSKWETPFDKRWTKDAPFHLTKRKKIDVPTMHKTKYFKYVKEKDFQLVELPYKGKQLSMLIFVPEKINGVGRVEKVLSRKNLDKWLGKMKRTFVSVKLPRFKATFSKKLNDAFKSMGMKDAFSFPIADFSGMDGTRMLYIEFVVHKAFVDVNEEGTEAAAATAVGMAAGSIPPKPITLKIDRPFVFLIRDNMTGSILFMGRITDPTDGKAKSKKRKPVGSAK